MRSRSVITALLASGIFLTGGSAALGVSSLVASDSASQAQYGSSTLPERGTLGAVTNSTDTNPPGGTNGPDDAGPDEGGPDEGVKGAGANNGGGDVRGAASTSRETIQPARQLAATSADGNQLPFTGFAAIPILIMGLALLASGVFLRRYGQRSETGL
ncbi:MAG: hypothetical protein M3417_10330 [Actinomycetota bacterium]|nr:hypothetical protein [Actinomycetota bacterium]